MSQGESMATRFPRPRRVLPGLLLAALAPMACSAGSEGPTAPQVPPQHEFRVEVLMEGLAHPWGLAFLPDGRMLVTERSGTLNLVDPDGWTRQRVAGVPPVDARNQGGLLDVALHPDFGDNRFVYLTWSGAGEQGNATHLGRGRLEGGRLADFQALFVATPFADSTKHFGSRLVFDGDGHLFMTVGERGQRDRAQDLADHNGSVLRLRPEGSIPPDNPFANRSDARDAIWSYGHRNPQGAALHPDTGRMWIHEHGPRGGDEVNIPRPGDNYGWPVITYGREYYGPEIGPDAKPGLQQPVHQWTPSIAPSGMAFYTGDAFPQWQGDLFVGALKFRTLVRLELEGDQVVGETRLLEDAGWRIRDVRQGSDGLLYLLTDSSHGKLVRLAPR